MMMRVRGTVWTCSVGRWVLVATVVAGSGGVAIVMQVQR